MASCSKSTAHGVADRSTMSWEDKSIQKFRCISTRKKRWPLHNGIVQYNLPPGSWLVALGNVVGVFCWSLLMIVWALFRGNNQIDLLRGNQAAESMHNLHICNHGHFVHGPTELARDWRRLASTGWDTSTSHLLRASSAVRCHLVGPCLENKYLHIPHSVPILWGSPAYYSLHILVADVLIFLLPSFCPASQLIAPQCRPASQISSNMKWITKYATSSSAQWEDFPSSLFFKASWRSYSEMAVAIYFQLGPAYYADPYIHPVRPTLFLLHSTSSHETLVWIKKWVEKL